MPRSFWFCLPVALLFASTTNAAEPTRPNVLIIVADDRD